jgi:tetratricopeptide (TPR) repeat protein
MTCLKMKCFVASLWTLSIVAGCASEGGGVAAPRTPRAATPPASKVHEPAPFAARIEAAPAHAPSVAAVESRRSGDLEPELSVWNDPAFRRRFAESYAAETEVEPRITEEERELMTKVLERISAEDLDGAAKLLAKERGDAGSAVLDFTLANLHFQRERLEEAAAAYQIAVDKFPKFRRAWRNLGLIRARSGEHALAVEALTRVLELGGGDAVVYGLLGFAHSGSGDPLAAESAYRMAALLEPKTLDWKMGLARCFFDQKRFTDAAALCGTLIEAQPDRADLWLLQANAFLGSGDSPRAAENYEVVESLGSATADSLATLADIYVNQELFDLAVASYVRALAKGTSAERALRAAKVLTSKGALAQARPLLDAIESAHGTTLGEGDRKDVLRLRARLAVAAGAGEEEARILEQIVELDPLDGEALILLGQHRGRSGDVERAIFYFERAASLEAFEADAKVRHAQLLVGQSKYAEALPLLRRAQTLEPRENIQEYLEQVERAAKVAR